MKRGGSRQLTLLQWVLIFGVWTLIGLTFGAQLYLAYSRGRQHISWTKALFLELTYWYLVGILSPGILWLARKFPIDRQRWLRNLLIHIHGWRLVLHRPLGHLSLHLAFRLGRGIYQPLFRQWPSCCAWSSRSIWR